MEFNIVNALVTGNPQPPPLPLPQKDMVHTWGFASTLMTYHPQGVGE